MQDIQGCQGHYTTVCALKLAPLVFVRPSELRGAKWEDIDLEAKEWRYFVSKTKTEHIVPLSSQAMTLLATCKASPSYASMTDCNKYNDYVMSNNHYNRIIYYINSDSVTAHISTKNNLMPLQANNSKALGGNIDYVK